MRRNCDPQNIVQPWPQNAPEVMGEVWARAQEHVRKVQLWKPYVALLGSFQLEFLWKSGCLCHFSFACITSQSLFLDEWNLVGKFARGWIADVPKIQPRFNPPETSFRPLWTWDHRMHQMLICSCDGLDYRFQLPFGLLKAFRRLFLRHLYIYI